MKRLLLAAFAFGLIYSLVFVTYVAALQARSALNAAVIDLQLGFLAIGSLQAWEASGRQFKVLAAEVLGMSVGSYCAVRWLTP
jgi:hypothetical protein